jgi:DNA-binding LacI/PurR family transcriptional regulator
LKSFQRQSLADQAADYLRHALATNRWRGVLPGIRQLTAELKVSRTCLDRAIARLTSEGLIEPGEAGHPRRIVERGDGAPVVQKIRRVGLLLDIPLYNQDAPTREAIIGIREALEACGIELTIARKTLRELAQPRSLLPGLIGHQQMDCWMVYGASRDVVKWFMDQSLPFLCVGGRIRDLPVSVVGYDASSSVGEAVDRLVAAGHQRIVMPVPQWSRCDDCGPSLSEEKFTERMKAAGLRVGPFNLPLWDDTPAGWRKLLEELFSFTPPTAVIVHVAPMYVALQSFLMERGLRIPSDVSAVLLSGSPTLDWIWPLVTHFDRPAQEFVSAIVNWVQRLGTEAATQEKIMLPGRFHEGATIAPPSAHRAGTLLKAMGTNAQGSARAGAKAS